MTDKNSTPPTPAENMYHIRKELERMSHCNDELKKDVADIKVDLARLTIKAGIIGAVGGALPVVVTVGIAILILLLKA